MRFTTGLLAAVASGSAMAQFGNSSSLIMSSTAEISTTTISTAAPSGSVGPPAPVNINTAELGEGASFTTAPNGAQAVGLSAAANGKADFAIPAPDLPAGVTAGDPVAGQFDLSVGDSAAGRKRAVTDCTLDVTINGVLVYSAVLETTGGAVVTKSTSAIPASNEQNIVFTQTCGDVPVSMTVSNIAVAAADAPSTSSIVPINPSTLPIPTPTGSATGTATGTGIPTGSATGTQTGSVSPTGTSTPGFPENVGTFAFFGCVGSTASFPSFTLAQSSAVMSLNLCSQACAGRAFFGVHEDDCYCGDRIDEATTSRVPLGECNLECPGEDTNICGGNPLLGRLSRRQSPATNIRLTVYVAVNGQVTSGLTTVTSTVTQTSTGALTTATSTVTAVYECIGSTCFINTGSGSINVYIFNGVPGADCDGEWVWIQEACSCVGGWQYVPFYCGNGACANMTVYKVAQCSDWWNQKNVYVPCDTTGTVVYQAWNNTWGTPAQPVLPSIPTCSGSNCPIPTPAGPTGTPAKPSTPVVVVGAASKQIVSGMAYVAAIVAAFL